MSAPPVATRIRFAPTYVNRQGLRTLVYANQGRHHFDTEAAAQKNCEALAANNTEARLVEIFGPQALGTFAVRRVECYDHGDAIGIYFDP